MFTLPPTHPALVPATTPTHHRARITSAALTQPNLSVSDEDDPTSLRSTWSHRAWVSTGCASVLVPLADSLSSLTDPASCAESALAVLVGYALADLGTGIYHWAIDNYGDASTPFQGHHRRPWTITRRGFANNLHALARAVALTVLPIEAVLLAHGGHPAAQAFVGACAGCVMFSQQFHAWAHGTRSRLPKAVVALQEAGVLVSRAEHARHHRAPYDGNYCIVSGLWNRVLDESRFFEAAEMVVFLRFGVRPRSWDETAAEWMEETGSDS
ncbi:hypothetical protein QJS04_geneDACA018201 [Acorus gramineus]|uniref:Lipid desaturase domain-containing protein n=1 Tax=Acorus gramineus TaxID=55184 RepID=A0AAV9BTK3_ACOGR|nr:hypothetical protein QJS04_geneDACA018201 [Acorus gramineus]